LKNIDHQSPNVLDYFKTKMIDSNIRETFCLEKASFPYTLNDVY